MKDPKKAKMFCKVIKVPEQLSYIVNKIFLKKKNVKRKKDKHRKFVLSTVTCVFLTFLLILNVSPSFAKTVSEIPIIGTVAKVFTIKEYKKEDNEKLIDAKIPGLENTGNTELEKRINNEIMLKINEILEEAEKGQKNIKKLL